MGRQGSVVSSGPGVVAQPPTAMPPMPPMPPRPPKKRYLMENPPRFGGLTEMSSRPGPAAPLPPAPPPAPLPAEPPLPLPPASVPAPTHTSNGGLNGAARRLSDDVQPLNLTRAAAAPAPALDPEPEVHLVDLVDKVVEGMLTPRGPADSERQRDPLRLWFTNQFDSRQPPGRPPAPRDSDQVMAMDMSKPPRPAAHSDQDMGKPPRPAGHSDQDMGRPPQPAAHSDQDTGRPPRPAAHSDQDMGRPPQPAAHSDQDTGRPPRPAAHSDQDTGRPPRPAAHSDQDTGRPPQPAGRRDQDAGGPARRSDQEAGMELTIGMSETISRVIDSVYRRDTAASGRPGPGPGPGRPPAAGTTEGTGPRHGQGEDRLPTRSPLPREPLEIVTSRAAGSAGAGTAAAMDGRAGGERTGSVSPGGSGSSSGSSSAGPSPGSRVQSGSPSRRGKKRCLPAAMPAANKSSDVDPTQDKDTPRKRKVGKDNIVRIQKDDVDMSGAESASRSQDA